MTTGRIAQHLKVLTDGMEVAFRVLPLSARLKNLETQLAKQSRCLQIVLIGVTKLASYKVRAPQHICNCGSSWLMPHSAQRRDAQSGILVAHLVIPAGATVSCQV